MNAFLNPASSTAYLLEEIALFGVMSGKGERDYRPLPEAEDVPEKVGAIMQTMADLFLQTRLEGEAEEMLWSVVNGFHRRVSHTQKRLDDKAGEVKTALGQQDGSEIKDVELQGLTDECRSLEEARNAFEAMREIASEHFQVITGKPWLPRTGSKISHGATTAAALDGRQYLKAKTHKEANAGCPEGTRIVFSGGQDFEDVDAIWGVLDKAKAKYPDMVLLHGGGRKGAELIASRWAANRGVHQVAFTPDYSIGRSAPFKRNDQMLAEMPQGVIVAPGGGIQEQLIRNARQKGVAVKRIGA